LIGKHFALAKNKPFICQMTAAAAPNCKRGHKKCNRGTETEPEPTEVQVVTASLSRVICHKVSPAVLDQKMEGHSKAMMISWNTTPWMWF